MHHGILGQKWGTRNGPPYPLKGGDYTETEWKALKKARKAKYSRYNKRHYDQVIKEGTELQTLARNPQRTNNADMFYAAYTKADKDRYNAIFNHKNVQPLYDENGNSIGTGKTYKWAIKNKAANDIKVASQDSGAKAVTYLYANDRDFMNFVRDPNRLGSYLKKMYVPNDKKYNNVLSKMHDKTYTPTDKDLHTIYDMINCVIPNQNKDVVNQRAKLFTRLTKDGYGALLDINDAINHPLPSNSPVIVFDPSSYILSGIKKTTMRDVYKSKITTIGRYALGLYNY
jgi:hypothetical protein